MNGVVFTVAGTTYEAFTTRKKASGWMITARRLSGLPIPYPDNFGDLSFHLHSEDVTPEQLEREVKECYAFHRQILALNPQRHPHKNPRIFRQI